MHILKAPKATAFLKERKKKEREGEPSFELFYCIVPHLYHVYSLFKQNLSFQVGIISIHLANPDHSNHGPDVYGVWKK